MKKDVIKYEEILNKSNKILNNVNKALDDLKNNQKDYLKLKEYYYSDEYQNDVKISDSTNEYDDINCGVLSQDAIFDLMTDSFDLYLRMLEEATKFIKQH